MSVLGATFRNVEDARAYVQGLKKDVSELKKEVADLNDLWTTYLAVARRAGLPTEIMDLMSRLQQLRIAGQTAIKTIELLKAAIAGAGPIGWALFIGSATLTGFMLADQMRIRRPQY